MLRFLKPGSQVWFHSSKIRPPMVGMVVRVWNQREVNLMVYDERKDILLPMYSVRVVLEGDPLPRWGYCYATLELPVEPPLLR